MQDETSKLIYELKLHESVNFRAQNMLTTVMRVPGGWIYTVVTLIKVKALEVEPQDKEKDKAEPHKEKKEDTERSFVSSTFVPITMEFNQ